MGEGGSGRDPELGLIRHNLEQIYKEILLSSIEIMLQQNKGWGKKCIHVRITCPHAIQWEKKNKDTFIFKNK